MDLRRQFEHPGQPVVEICFPDSAIVSIVTRGPAGKSIEARFVGFEGMTGVAVLMGDDRSPNEAYVQLAGTGHVISTDILRAAMDAAPSLRLHFLRYAHALFLQTTQTILANGRARIDARLARWLLMAADRAEGAEMALTHEFLSLMLGVRRPGVTDALHRLEGDHLIRAKRSSITIRDRPGLERAAEGFYGVSEAEYERLFGAFRPGLIPAAA